MLLDDFQEIDKLPKSNPWPAFVLWFLLSHVIAIVVTAGGAFTLDFLGIRGDMVQFRVSNEFLRYWFDILPASIALSFVGCLSLGLFVWRTFERVLKDQKIVAVATLILWLALIGIWVYISLMIFEGRVRDSILEHLRKTFMIFGPFAISAALGSYLCFYYNRKMFLILVYLATVLISTSIITCYRYFDLLR